MNRIIVIHKGCKHEYTSMFRAMEFVQSRIGARGLINEFIETMNETIDDLLSQDVSCKELLTGSLHAIVDRRPSFPRRSGGASAKSS